MQDLWDFHHIIINNQKETRIRAEFPKIDWTNRGIAIKGIRGTGKTTLALQYLKEQIEHRNALYLSADHHWFYSNTLFDAAKTFYTYGGRLLVIDEIHKYPNWSRELKNMYDGFPDLQIVVTASSALDLYRGEADLSRRFITYTLPGLSFREFLFLKYNTEFPAITLDELTKNHSQLAVRFQIPNLSILALFEEYLKSGYLPIRFEANEETYHIKLNQIINTTIDTDLSYSHSLTAGSAFKLKRLLGVLAESAPFKPNIASIAQKVDISRDTVYSYLYLLEQARLLNHLHQDGKGISLLQKPDKIYLENTNFAHVLSKNADVGTRRETFVLNQLKNAAYEVSLPIKGDFRVGDFIFEVGGKAKTINQIADWPQAFIVSDQILTGYANRIPIWLFGFLY